MANSVPLALALVILLMQYDVIQSLPFKNTTMHKAPHGNREGLLHRLANQWKMGAPIKLSKERMEQMTIGEYNKLVREIVEDSNGSHMIDIGEFKPIKKLLADRHFYMGKDGEINKMPIFGRHNQTQQQLRKITRPDKTTVMKQMGSNRRKRAAEKDKYLDYLSWPNADVPYITTNMQTGDNFIPWIQDGIEMFHEESCVQWTPRTTETEYVDFMGGDQDGFCAAYIGRLHDTPSPVYLDQVTSNCDASYVVVHEMLHAIGMEHEQSRPDRSSSGSIDLYWECIAANAINNYVKRPLATNVAYDFTSIMQYYPGIFNNCNNKGTMATKNPSYDFLLYTLVETLTHYDTQSVVKAYGCDEGCTDNCQNGGFIRKTVNNGACHCRCPEYLAGPTCDTLESSCGGIIELTEGDTQSLTTEGFPGQYPVGGVCTYLIKAPVDNRILITMKSIDIPCGHSIEFRTHLIGEFGLLECGTSTTEKEFVTFPNGESNIAMIILHAEDNISPGTGSSLEVTAFKSGCIGNPCRNGGTCDEGIAMPAFCICPEGYSGDTCNFVSATATVGCDLNNDECGFTDVSTGSLEFFPTRAQDDVLRPYLLAYTVGTYFISDEALFESNVVFEAAVRCLSFEEAVFRDTGSNAKVRTLYTDNSGAETVLSDTVDTDGFFEVRQATLPPTLTSVRFGASIYLGAAAISDILISPGPCSGATCASLSFSLCYNGGACVDTSGTAACACSNGYTGPNCQIPPDPCSGVDCGVNGNCVVDGADTTSCSCINGYTGPVCETPPPDPCSGVDCGVNGNCVVDGADTTSCSCINGYTGPVCETPPPAISTFKCTFETGDTCPIVGVTSVSAFDTWTNIQGATAQRGTGPKRAYARERYLSTNGQTVPTTSTLQFTIGGLSDSPRCLLLNYNMNGRHIQSLAVFHDGSNLFQEIGNKRDNWLTTKIDVTARPDSVLTIVGKASNKKGDIAIDDVELLPFTCDKILICTFEKTAFEPCIKGGSRSWTRKSSSTSTGPQRAHDGYYFVYLRSKRKADALLQLPHSFSGAACLSFFYHMHGPSIGALNVYTQTTGGTRQSIWTRSGDQGNQWLMASISIPIITGIQVSIEATTPSQRTDGLGVIAIDTVVMVNNGCP